MSGELITMTKDNHDALIGGLYGQKSTVINLGVSNQLLIERALKVDTKPSQPTPPYPVRPICYLLAVGVMSLVIGANYPEETTMGKANTHKMVPMTPQNIQGTRLSMIAGDHAGALKGWQKAYLDGECAEECLFRIAECQFRLKQYPEALKTCSELDLITSGKSAKSFLVRGWIYQASGQPKSAKAAYETAFKMGEADAEILAKGVK